MRQHKISDLGEFACWNIYQIEFLMYILHFMYLFTTLKDPYEALIVVGQTFHNTFSKDPLHLFNANRVFSSQIKVIAESNDAIIAFQTQRGPIHFRAALKFLFESAIVVITSHFLIFQPHYRQNFEKSFYQRCGYSILYIIIRRRQYYRVAGNLRFICCKLLGKSSSLK